MIDFYSETAFTIDKADAIREWISETILQESCQQGDITYVFCDDSYLSKLNVQFLGHDTLTDIISFDNSLGIQIHGEIYISVERVIENAKTYGVSFSEELHRVLIHGILHFCGYKDKTDGDQERMTQKENEALARRLFV
ncbi:MAG: putative rRNA maturation factor [Patiriisocius sp.]|jgi:probable rRNA maturation factor